MSRLLISAPDTIRYLTYALAVCVTRFDLSECVICSKSDFRARKESFLLSWDFETSLNCSVINGSPPRWFECYFRRSCWIYCWSQLAVLSEHFGHLVSSTFLLCNCWGLHGYTPDSLPVMRRWKCLGLKRSSQPIITTFGKRAEKTYRKGNRWSE